MAAIFSQAGGVWSRLSQTEDRNRCWSAAEMTVRTETASAAAASFDVASIATARTRQ